MKVAVLSERWTALTRKVKVALGVLAIVAWVAAGCGSDGADATGAADDRPVVVVTSSILGDVVGSLIGDQAEVVTIMPVGADPHAFQASAQEVDRLLSADVVILNGAGFEEGLLDIVESARADGVPTFEAIDAVDGLEFGAVGDDDHGQGADGEEADDHDDNRNDEHAEDEHGENEHAEDEHDHGRVDPHFFTDPNRMADAVTGIAAFLETEVDGIDENALDAAVADYIAQLDALDAEVDGLLAPIPDERRVLVTNHEVFGYFADRYGFEVVGVVIPGGATVDAASPGELADLAAVIRAEGVPAVFADTSSSNELAETLAAEAGDVTVVELYSESLGEPGSDGETYLDMIRANATRIANALA